MRWHMRMKNRLVQEVTDAGTFAGLCFQFFLKNDDARPY